MLYYDRIDFSEGIDVNKTNESKECDICHYWYYKHSQCWFDYHCIISRISKNETIKGIQNIDLIKKSI